MNMDIPTINSRLVSSVQKRQVMWNIIEPGDPYDIRKSMIAKLPGRKNFMGDHLELVCLLQAAEIERLCEYLDEYKLKFREIERRQLDRHSYEVQIKELTMRISDEGNYKAENLKLRQFLRKQSAQYEELKKKGGSGGQDSDLVRKYEESLRQIEIYIRENDTLKESISKLRTEYQQNLSSRSYQLEEMQRKFRDVSSQSQSARGQAYYKLQIEYKKLQFENKRIKQIVEGKNREIDELQAKSKQLVYQFEEQSAQLRQYANYPSTIKQYQNRFSLLGQQIERLNLVLRDKSAQFSETSNRLRTIEEQRRRLSEYNSQLESRRSNLQENYRQLEIKLIESSTNQNVLDESRTIVKTYESNLQKLSMEIERLNNVLRKKMAELDQSNRRLSEYEFQLRKNESTKKEVEEFRARFSEFNRKMAQYQNKIAITSQQIERLNSLLKKKSQQYSSLEQLLKTRSSDLELAQKQYYNLQIEYKTQMNYITSNYQSKITELETSRYNDNRLEWEKMNAMLASKTSEIERLQGEVLSSKKRQSMGDRSRQVENDLSSAREENSKLRLSLDQYQQRIVMLSQQIQRLNSFLKRSNNPSPSKQADSLQSKKIVQYENKLAILTQQIQRLNQSIKNRDGKIRNLQGDLQSLRRRQEDHSDTILTQYKRRQTQSYSEIQRLKQQLRNIQINLNRKNSDQQLAININKENEGKIRQLYEENNQLSKQLSESQYQLSALSHEIQRLNGVLKLKVQALDTVETRTRASSREIDQLRRKIAEYQNKIALLGQEIERLRSNHQLNTQMEFENLKKKNAESERKAQQFESTIRQYQIKFRSFEQQTRSYEQQTRSVSNELQTLRSTLTDAGKRISDYQNKIMLLSRQIERLNQLLEKFNAENQDLRRRLGDSQGLRNGLGSLQKQISNLNLENDQLRRRLTDQRQSQGKLAQNYESRVKQLSLQRQQQLRRNQQLETKIVFIVQQLEHSSSVLKDREGELAALQGRARSLLQQNQNLTRKTSDLNNTARKVGQYDNKIALLSQQIERLNDILRNKVQEISILQNKCKNYEFQVNNWQRKVTEIQNGVARDLQTKNIYLSKQNEEIKLRLRQFSQQAGKVPEIQNKLALTLGEVQRLNSNLRNKVEEINSLNGKYRIIEQQLQRSKRKSEELESVMHRELKNQSSVFEQRVSQLNEQNEALRRSLREYSDTNRRIPQLEGKLVILSNQIQRLNQLLAKYSKQIVPSLEERNRQIALQYDQFRRKYSELSEINKQGQQTISKLRLVSQQNQQSQRRIQEYETRMGQISSEIQRLNGVLRGRIEQLSNADSKIKQLSSENQQITKRLRETSQSARRVGEYQSKMALLGQQIQRLNLNLRGRSEQLASVEGKLRVNQHQSQSLQRRIAEMQGSFSQQKMYRGQLQQKLAALVAQNDQMRRTLRDLSDSNRRLADYESRITLLSQQVQRLNSNLRMKIQELAASQNFIRNYKKEAEVKFTSVSTQLQEYRRKAGQNMSSQASRLSEYEGKMVTLSKEIQRLNHVLKDTTYEIQASQARQKNCLQEIERLNNTLRLKVEECSRWQQANSQLKSKIRSFEESLSAAGLQYERLKSQNSTLSEEYKKSNQHLVDYEQSINKLYQEFERLQSIIQSLKKQNYQLKVRLQDAGNLVEKNRMLSAQIDRLLQIIEQQTVDLQELRLNLADQSALQKRINEYMALMVVLFAEIESLRKRVKDTEKQIQSVRRSSLAPFKV